jgi:hypothetical protein
VAIVICLVAGVCAGLGAAAGGLALGGQALFDAPPATAEVLLVLLPAAGCLPLAAVVFVGRARPAVLRRLPAALAVWLVAAAVTTLWFGIHPLVR